MIKQRTAAITTAVALAAVARLPVFACQCGDIASLEDARLNAHAIFEGQVEGRWPRLDRELNDTALPVQTYRFLVLKSWKGEVSRSLVVSGHGGDCDFRFNHGETYLVFANSKSDEPKVLSTSKCTRTKEITAAEADITLLGETHESAAARDGVREDWFVRTCRRTWTSALIAYAWTEYYLRRKVFEHSVTGVVSRTAIVLLTAVLGFPTIRLARKYPLKLAVAIVAVVALSGLIVVGVAYHELRGNPWLSYYLY